MILVIETPRQKTKNLEGLVFGGNVKQKIYPKWLAAAFLLVAMAQVAAADNRPNIIFLMTDDQRWDCFGCYGRPEFETHNLDRLAREGVIFDNAYYAVSICMPSRVTMMTGRYLSSHRVGFTAPYNNTLSYSDLADSYPAMLKRAGYRTGFIGKLGFSVTEQTEQSNLAEDPDYKIQDHVGNVFDYFADEYGTHCKGGQAIWPENDKALQAIYRKQRVGSSRTFRTGEAMLHFLDTQPADQPFCLSVSFYAVKKGHYHKPHREKFKNQVFSIPENWVEGANETLPKVVAKHARGFKFHVERTSTQQKYQKLVREFATQGYTVDHQVGLLMDKLKASGKLGNTIIIYTSDNGRFHGSHGLYDKCLLYEESMKAPLIVYDGRVAAAKSGRRETALVSSVDMAPTIVSLAGLQPPASMQGRDLSAVLAQTQDMSTWRETVFMENLFLQKLIGPSKKAGGDLASSKLVQRNESYRTHGIRSGKWKYFVYYEHDPVIEELYDLSTDPLEQNNLASAPEQAETLRKFRARTKEMHEAARRRAGVSAKGQAPKK